MLVGVAPKSAFVTSRTVPSGAREASAGAQAFRELDGRARTGTPSRLSCQFRHSKRYSRAPSEYERSRPLESSTFTAPSASFRCSARISARTAVRNSATGYGRSVSVMCTAPPRSPHRCKDCTRIRCRPAGIGRAPATHWPESVAGLHTQERCRQVRIPLSQLNDLVRSRGERREAHAGRRAVAGQSHPVPHDDLRAHRRGHPPGIGAVPGEPGERNVPRPLPADQDSLPQGRRRVGEAPGVGPGIHPLPAPGEGVRATEYAPRAGIADSGHDGDGVREDRVLPRSRSRPLPP